MPYTASRVFARIYGKSLGALWREYEDSLAASTSGFVGIGDGATRLTHDGFIVTGPRFDRERAARALLESSIRPSRRTNFRRSMRCRPMARSPYRLATRYLGSTSAPGRDFIVFDQLELRRNAGLYSDLYVLDRRSGRVRQLTSEARLLDPDLSPDESTLASVQDAAGRRDLVLVRLKSGTTA